MHTALSFAHHFFCSDWQISTLVPLFPISNAQVTRQNEQSTSIIKKKNAFINWAVVDDTKNSVLLLLMIEYLWALIYF